MSNRAAHLAFDGIPLPVRLVQAGLSSTASLLQQLHVLALHLPLPLQQLLLAGAMLCLVPLLTPLTLAQLHHLRPGHRQAQQTGDMAGAPQAPYLVTMQAAKSTPAVTGAAPQLEARAQTKQATNSVSKASRCVSTHAQAEHKPFQLTCHYLPAECRLESAATLVCVCLMHTRSLHCQEVGYPINMQERPDLSPQAGTSTLSLLMGI